jgi:hypothetical protein
MIVSRDHPLRGAGTLLDEALEEARRLGADPAVMALPKNLALLSHQSGDCSRARSGFNKALVALGSDAYRAAADDDPQQTRAAGSRNG